MDSISWIFGFRPEMNKRLRLALPVVRFAWFAMTNKIFDLSIAL